MMEIDGDEDNNNTLQSFDPQIKNVGDVKKSVGLLLAYQKKFNIIIDILKLKNHDQLIKKLKIKPSNIDTVYLAKSDAFNHKYLLIGRLKKDDDDNDDEYIYFYLRGYFKQKAYYHNVIIKHHYVCGDDNEIYFSNNIERFWKYISTNNILYDYDAGVLKERLDNHFTSVIRSSRSRWTNYYY